MEAGFLVQDRDHWCIATLKPGEAPLQHLAQALLKTVDDPLSSGVVDALSAQLHEEGVEAALHCLEATEPTSGSNILLVVDQFEELFRFGLSHEDPVARDQAETFVALLLRLAEQRRFPVYVCITMRSDFLGDCDTFIGLPEAINAGQFLVPRLTRNQRRIAIEGPIRLARGEITPRLVDRLLNENVDTRDDLPILQHLLMRVWDVWTVAPDGPIDLKHYKNVHTIHRALDHHAEEALKELAPADRTLARRLFQALTELDSGNRRIRRPAHLSDVRKISKAPNDRIMAVIERFRVEGRNFLVLSSTNPKDDPLIDISHESLIRQWETLHDWVDEEAAAAKLYRRLAETAALYAKDEAGLYRDADLQQALAWQKRYQPNPDWAKRYPGDFGQAMVFLRQSRIARCTDKREKKRARLERERLLREKAELAERQAQQEREARRKARSFTKIMAVFAVAMMLLAGTAVYFWVEADRQTKAAVVAEEEAKQAKEETEQQFLTASFNLAKAHEEKAVGILNEPEERRGTMDYQRALLLALQAQLQEIGGKPALRFAARNRLSQESLAHLCHLFLIFPYISIR